MLSPMRHSAGHADADGFVAMADAFKGRRWRPLVAPHAELDLSEGAR